LDIIKSSLVGSLGNERISIFTEKVERDDFQWPYKVTWCGVYSIPFGLSVLSRLSELIGREAPEGFMLRYGTTLDPGRIPLDYTGLGVTNINTLRHWVGHTAIGYW
ncbi:MAG: AmmeMemoRadiSam system protein B, partial [Candidatus Krumholzibacteria bacterium]|nr:AmmeMemoRadiSam system protein B [Candidatus Krumholzibacteria bacterium]